MTIAYLGPDGSFSHLLTRRRFPEATDLRPFPGVPEVFDFVCSTPGALGVVPIENSSGGMIMPTVDSLMEHSGTVFVQELLLLDVKLALLGRTGVTPEVVYSHVVPLQHSEKWLKRTYPATSAVASKSTSHAVKLAVDDRSAAAIAPRENAAAHGLDVLHFPIEEGVPNVTQFYVIGHARATAGDCSAYVVSLPNKPGALYRFLAPFNEHGVNLTRIQSRPIFGKPNTHLFFVELTGDEDAPNVAAALSAARLPDVSERLESLGSFPGKLRFQS
jgi:chorismate mutase/prephenate dehydratase